MSASPTPPADPLAGLAGQADPLAALAAREGVGSAYAAARDGIDAVLRDRGLRRVAAETTVESLLRGAHASAVLAGSTATLEELRTRPGDVDEIAAAALRISAGLLALVPVIDRSPLQALARLHTLAAGPDADPAATGRPRTPEAARRLGEIGRLLTRPTAAPALLVAAVVHAELATAEPFASHHELVARATERLVLVARGVDGPSATVPEAGHLALGAAYADGLGGYRDGGDVGVHSWLLLAARAYAGGAEASPLAR